MNGSQHIGGQDRILGSAEPLTPEQTRERLRELAEWGVDLSLVQAHLALTPTERLQRMMELLAIGQALHQSYVQLPQVVEQPDRQS